MKKEKGLYWKLFLSTFRLSAFTFGGGYVIITLMRKRFVEELGWLDENEMLDLTALAQSAPGPIVVNASILVGYRMAGVAGSWVALLGTVLPPLILMSVVSLFYEAFKSNAPVAAALRGMRAGVAAVMVDVVATMGKDVAKEKSLLSLLLMGASFVAVFFFEVNVILVLAVCGLVGVVVHRFARRKEAKGKWSF